MGLGVSSLLLLKDPKANLELAFLILVLPQPPGAVGEAVAILA